jgi:hypothetical protein
VLSIPDISSLEVMPGTFIDENMKEAIGLYIEASKEDGKLIPDSVRVSRVQRSARSELRAKTMQSGKPSVKRLSVIPVSEIELWLFCMLPEAPYHSLLFSR